jgi:hypothetical protein
VERRDSTESQRDGCLEQETEDSALVLRRLLGSITLLPTRPDIRHPDLRDFALRPIGDQAVM